MTLWDIRDSVEAESQNKADIYKIIILITLGEFTCIDTVSKNSSTYNPVTNSRGNTWWYWGSFIFLSSSLGALLHNNKVLDCFRVVPRGYYLLLSEGEQLDDNKESDYFMDYGS